MAKVRINKLPPGFRLVDGKIVQDEQPNMQMGGYVTGDQMNYGLVTVPSNVSNQQMSVFLLFTTCNACLSMQASCFKLLGMLLDQLASFQRLGMLLDS